MAEWPELTERQLRERLALDDDAFAAYLLKLAASVGPREHTAELVERALGYPWERPEGSYVLDDGEVSDVAGGVDVSGRHPLLAFGSNGAPERLALKLEARPREDRRVVVLTGRLHGFDVGPAALPTFYGALPATIFPSAGTAVRAATLWLTAPQLQDVVWTEISYRFGRLPGGVFTPDIDGAPAAAHVYGFASRVGSLLMDGEHVALAAIPASGRTAPARTQEQLLGALAAELGLDGAHDLIRALYDEYGATVHRLAELLGDCRRPFAADDWTPYPSA